MLSGEDRDEPDVVLGGNSGRRDVFGMRSPRMTVNADAFNAPTPVPPLPLENRHRREVFGEEAHGDTVNADTLEV